MFKGKIYYNVKVYYFKNIKMKNWLSQDFFPPQNFKKKRVKLMFNWSITFGHPELFNYLFLFSISCLHFLIVVVSFLVVDIDRKKTAVNAVMTFNVSKKNLDFVNQRS